MKCSLWCQIHRKKQYGMICLDFGKQNKIIIFKNDLIQRVILKNDVSIRNVQSTSIKHFKFRKPITSKVPIVTLTSLVQRECTNVWLSYTFFPKWDFLLRSDRLFGDLKPVACSAAVVLPRRQPRHAWRRSQFKHNKDWAS